MKKLGIVIVIILLVFLGIFLTRNFIAQNILSSGVKAFTGLSLKIGSIDVGISKTHLSVQNLQLFNPPAFSDKVMLDMPEIYIDYDLGAFLQKKVHLEQIRLNMNELMVVKNKDGKLNLDSLKVVQSKKKPTEEQKKEKAQLPQIQIDKLRLTVGKVVYKDYSVSSSEPSVKEFNVNLDEQFENITDPYALTSLIVVKALAKTSIASLANFNLSDLQKNVTDMAQKAASAAKESVEKIGADAQKAVGEVTKSLEETGKGLTETFKLPFGK
ncbi:MAG: AsmA family protein [Candidatus Omnitrophota bacterium]